MGVYGLTTFVREHRRSLSKPTVLPGAGLVDLVVDGWALLYELHTHPSIQCQWVTGGEYTQLGSLLKSLVHVWLAVGLRIHWVFDGPYSPQKFGTAISRTTENFILPARLFFRTSPTARSTSAFLREHRILPPLTYSASVSALHSLAATHPNSLKLYWADGEADGYCVALAAKLGGYVTSRDSDYVVLNAPGCKGYVPLDEMEWSWSSAEETPMPGSFDDGGFQPVSTRKRKTSRPTLLSMPSSPGPQISITSATGVLPIFPIPLPSDLRLTFPVYTPAALAAYLNISPRLLPLLGALSGNDFTPPSQSRLFFESRITPTERITRVANALPQMKKGRGALEMIDEAVARLLLRGSSSLTTDQRTAIVERVAESTLHYLVPAPSPSPGACALHDDEDCPLHGIITCGDDDETVWRDVRAMYLDAYRAGALSPRLLDVVSTGTFWPRTFLEDPDKPACAAAVGGPVREWVYAVLGEGLGIGSHEEPDEDEDEDSADEDDSDLVSVVEIDSEVDDGGMDELAAKLRQLCGDSPPSSLSSSRTLPAPSVTEHVRVGARFIPRKVRVHSLPTLLSRLPPSSPTSPPPSPIQLAPREVRLTLFLRMLSADLPRLHDLAPDRLSAALALRLAARSAPAKERWTRREARAFLDAFDWAVPVEAAAGDGRPPPIVQVANRAVQLAAQALAALEAVEMLAQALLLAPAAVASPAWRFSGRAFHLALGANATGEQEQPVVERVQDITELWDVASEGLEDIWAGEGRSSRSGTIRAKVKERTESPLAKRSPVGRTGMYDLLMKVPDM